MLKRFRVWLGVVLPRPPRASWVCVSGLCAGLCSVLWADTAAFAATTKQDARSVLARAIAADELTRATIAREIGDDTLLSLLHQTEDQVLRLAAVRCSPYLSDPDRALLELTVIAGGRDPELSPAAALRLLQIALALLQRAGTLEIDLDSVSTAHKELSDLADDRSAIATIRLHAGQASYLLGLISARLAHSS